MRKFEGNFNFTAAHDRTSKHDWAELPAEKRSAHNPLLRCSTMICLLGLAVLHSSLVYGQDYPSKPVRIIAGSPGSSNDIFSRLIAPGVSATLGQQLIVDNRAGGSAISGAVVAKAPPDGYTLITVANSFWVAPLLQSTPYDVVRDFSPITAIANAPLVLIVHPSLPVKSVSELIALTKARPGDLNYSTAGSGTSYIAAELFKTMANVNIVRINYSSSTAALTGVVSGEVSIAFDTSNVVMTHVKSGKLKALGVTTLQPSALVPGMPTVASSGLPGFEIGLLSGILAPAKTPQTIITRLNQEMVRVLNDPDMKVSFLARGVEVVASSPEYLTNAIRVEIERVGMVIKQSGIK